MYFSNKHNLHLKNIAYFTDFSDVSPSNKVRKIVIAKKHPVSSALQLS